MPITVTESFEGGAAWTAMTTENTIFDTVSGDPTSGPKFVDDLNLYGTSVGSPRSGLACGTGRADLKRAGSSGSWRVTVPAPIISMSCWLFAGPHASSGDGIFNASVSLAQALSGGTDQQGVGLQIGSVGSFTANKQVRASYTDTTAPPTVYADPVALPTGQWLEATYSSVDRVLRVTGSGFAYESTIVAKGKTTSIVPEGVTFTQVQLFTDNSGTDSAHYTWYEDLSITYEGEPPPTVLARPALRRYPRDDALGFGGVKRTYPPPRGRRIVGGQP